MPVVLLHLLTLFAALICCNCGSQSTFYGFDEKAANNTIALTFDDGPHGTLTPRLLNILKDKGAKATFFVMGIKAVMHPGILKRAMEEGHEIANHAWNHPVMSKLSRDEVHNQLSRTTVAIEDATGARPAVMRPPYGNTNKKLNEHIFNEENLRVIIWSLDTIDWKRPAPEQIVNRTASLIKSGSVILCHDIHPGTIKAMPVLIDRLIAEGYKFATVSELIAMQEPAASNLHQRTHSRERYKRRRAADDTMATGETVVNGQQRKKLDYFHDASSSSSSSRRRRSAH
mmetsp:Transcript_19748/g.33565  ORF Transcript_19748/g.33565 Transcript_19748/m.33565 type:complete len:286 (-) Transcript_19748:1342-2199(-)